LGESFKAFVNGHVGRVSFGGAGSPVFPPLSRIAILGTKIEGEEGLEARPTEHPSFPAAPASVMIGV
jgi:hypothetical protein